MPRGYRCIVLAAVGLLILGASPQDGSKIGGNEANAEGQIANSLGTIANALKAASESKPEAAACPVGDEDRKSELCAQWKAADAAADSAYWNWTTFVIGIIGTVLGTVTMGAAIAAAWYAREAARHTEAGARAANDALIDTRAANALLLRPYIAIVPLKEDLGSKLDWSPEGFLRFAIENFGQVPSRQVNFLTGIDFFDQPIGTRNVEEFASTEVIGPLNPGETVNISIHFADIEADKFEGVRVGKFAMVTRIRIEYDLGDGQYDTFDISCVISKYLLSSGRGVNRLTNEERRRA